jgi:hypothetical protein
MANRHQSLGSPLDPRSVAVVGTSRNPGKLGYHVVRSLAESGCCPSTGRTAESCVSRLAFHSVGTGWSMARGHWAALHLDRRPLGS